MSTPDGIKIIGLDEPTKADDSIRVNDEFESNEIDESDLPFEEQKEQRISTLRGIQTN
jgi:hypothetical protein